MTKFMKAINTVNTGERKARIPKLSFDMNMDSKPSSVSSSTAVKVNFDLQYKAFAWVPENDGKMLEMARSDIIEKFRREVYGDVEDGVIKIVEGIYEGQDEQELLRLCSELMKILEEK